MIRTSRCPLSPERAMVLLRRGVLSIEGRVPWSSNATLLGELTFGDLSVHAIYKPARGERPLWDFPAGTLCLRETAAYVVSQELGWGLVPPTVMREGPWGRGAVQLFIPHDPDIHYLAMDRPDPQVIQRIVAFDVVVNNADRKSGHVLEDIDGRLWAIDHGVSFHEQPKLRTVIWDHAGQSLPANVAADLELLAGALDYRESTLLSGLRALLSPAEIEALRVRTRELLSAGAFPQPHPDRREWPWPVV